MDFQFSYWSEVELEIRLEELHQQILRAPESSQDEREEYRRIRDELDFRRWSDEPGD